jgi:hypothetical protein
VISCALTAIACARTIGEARWANGKAACFSSRSLSGFKSQSGHEFQDSCKRNTALVKALSSMG